MRLRSTELLRQIDNEEDETVEPVMAMESRDGDGVDVDGVNVDVDGVGVDAESEAFCIDDVFGVEDDRRRDNENQNAAKAQCLGLKKAFARIGYIGKSEIRCHDPKLSD